MGLCIRWSAPICEMWCSSVSRGLQLFFTSRSSSRIERPVLRMSEEDKTAAAASAPHGAAIGLSEHGFNTTCITKLFPTRSHTVASQLTGERSALHILCRIRTGISSCLVSIHALKQMTKWS